MAPTIVVEEGKPILTVTCPGGAIIPTALLQVMLNVLELDMDMQTALEVARIQNVAYTEADENNIFTGDGSTHKLISVEKWAGGLSDEVVQQLTDKNYSVFKFSADGVTHVYGITINYDSDGKATMTGGADNRRDGVAMAY
jgi:gamma-glutamyltranspeptidase/glutathione hydrolase